jgi:prolyl oligopeptidase
MRHPLRLLRPFVALVLAVVVPAPSAFAAAQAQVATAPAGIPVAAPAPGPLAYPATARVDQIETLHGVEVRDPYRWLEEDVRESPKVAEWVEAQNRVTHAYLDTLFDRPQILARLRELYDFEKYKLPEKEGGRYFFDRNDGLQNQFVLHVQDRLDGPAEVLVDPNTWSADGTVALAGSAPSPDGRWVALSIQDGGSDWRKVRVLDLASRKQLDEEVAWVKFSGISWRRDGSGFYYSRYPAPEKGQEMQALNHGHALYFHRIGTAQSADRLVYARADHPDWGYGAEVTDDDRYLVITVWKGTDDRYQVAVQDLAEPGSEPRMLIEGFDHGYTLVGNRGSVLYFRTTRDAPRGRLIAIDLARPEPQHWTEVIPQRAEVLEWATLVGGRLITGYMQDAHSLVEVHELDGRLVRTVDLPGLGTAFGFSGHADDPETFFVYTSYNVPDTIYRYDVTTGARTVFKQPEVKFAPADYTVSQVFYRSKDGTRVPMFVTHRKDVTPNGDRPTLLYGYGGFNVSLTPAFSVSRLAWMEMGGVYAVANLRGGGEYGEDWHAAGTKLRKQNVFDDFIAAGEHLVASGWTKPSRLAVIGGSNGGLLVGAVVNQRPDLFGAAVPAVGVMDMLRFHRFTAGRFWVDDYGSADHPEEFRALLAYSPYHNIKPGTRYPAILATTADHDDRVVPGHSFKYMAALQAAQAGPAPVLIRIETRAGHGAGKPTDKILREWADQWAFLAANLGMGHPESGPVLTPAQ